MYALICPSVNIHCIINVGQTLMCTWYLVSIWVHLHHSHVTAFCRGRHSYSEKFIAKFSQMANLAQVCCPSESILWISTQEPLTCVCLLELSCAGCLYFSSSSPLFTLQALIFWQSCLFFFFEGHHLLFTVYPHIGCSMCLVFCLSVPSPQACLGLILRGEQH